MRFLLFGGFYFGKIWKILEKRPFFRADMAGLGKYCTGGYGRIGVYRVNHGEEGRYKTGESRVQNLLCHPLKTG